MAFSSALKRSTPSSSWRLFNRLSPRELLLLTLFVSMSSLVVESHAAQEEVTPLDQYTDSGETFRVDGGSLLPGTALRQLIRLENNAPNQISSQESEVDKRSWNKMQGVWGKRSSAQPQANWNGMRAVWGKRSPETGTSLIELPSLGMPSTASNGKWNQLRQMWGKRTWQNMNQMWGRRKREGNDLKRAAPHWNHLRGMWG